MARILISADAGGDLQRLARTHSLPSSTERRFRSSIAPLESFPTMGSRLSGRFVGRRFVLGPWRWMIITYRYLPEQDVVQILRVFDGRSSSSPTAPR